MISMSARSAGSLNRGINHISFSPNARGGCLSNLVVLALLGGALLGAKEGFNYLTHMDDVKKEWLVDITPKGIVQPDGVSFGCNSGTYGIDGFSLVAKIGGNIIFAATEPERVKDFPTGHLTIDHGKNVTAYRDGALASGAIDDNIGLVTGNGAKTVRYDFSNGQTVLAELVVSVDSTTHETLGEVVTSNCIAR
jgi:hypothetical protein